MDLVFLRIRPVHAFDMRCSTNLPLIVREESKEHSVLVLSPRVYSPQTVGQGLARFNHLYPINGRTAACGA
jgi:hypothetical protein